MTSESTPQQPRIWQMRCTALDAVLSSSFEWRELQDLARAEWELRPPCPTSAALHHRERSIHDAHVLCHRPTRFARLIEKQLDLKHRAVMRVCSNQDVTPLRRLLLRESLVACPDLAAVTWAVCRDPREDVQALLPLFLTRMQRIALQALCGDSVAV